ncbi:MAG: four helix bundle protein, partial [Deltaproteobacteria bacterium]|nr:four helix bundle protein [Deltaproteobacteria bacterium]
MSFNRARSRADFANRIKICESEASETRYWLEVITDSGMFDVKRARKDHEVQRTAGPVH